jgi:hypothetical protein
LFNVHSLLTVVKDDRCKRVIILFHRFFFVSSALGLLPAFFGESYTKLRDREEVTWGFAVFFFIWFPPPPPPPV